MRDFVCVTLVRLGVGTGFFRGLLAAGTDDVEVVGAELGVVEEKGRLHGGFLFKGDFSLFVAIIMGDFEVRDLAAAKELA